MYHMIYRVRECIVRLEIANPIFVRLHVGGEGRGAGFVLRSESYWTSVGGLSLIHI